MVIIGEVRGLSLRTPKMRSIRVEDSIADPVRL